MLSRLVSGALTVGFAINCAGLCAQTYPNRTVRIVTSEPGGGSDQAARLLAQGMAPSLGQSVIVENRPSNILGGIVAKAVPDGHTLLLSGGSFLIGPLLQKTSYDPVKDFEPITLAATAPNVLVVHSSVPVKSVQELITLARAKPGQLNYASTGAGGISHLAAEMLKSMAGINIVRVPYKGTGQAATDLLSGQVQVMFIAIGTAEPHVKSGRLKALAVTSPQPSALAPGLPTVAASGLPGYEAGILFGLYAPAKTPAAAINRLNREAVQVLNRSDVKETLLGVGVEAVGNSSREFAAAIKAELARTSKVIKDAGIREE